MSSRPCGGLSEDAAGRGAGELPLRLRGSVTRGNGRVAQLPELLLPRLPGPNLPVTVLRQRSWWSGPEVLLVVDDYDLVVTPSASPLLPIADFLAQGRDPGFHVLVARRAGGAARAVFEPVLQRLKELGTPGLLLSGDRHEGPLLGPYPPMPQPPGRGLLVAHRSRSCSRSPGLRHPSRPVTASGSVRPDPGRLSGRRRASFPGHSLRPGPIGWSRRLRGAWTLLSA